MNSLNNYNKYIKGEKSEKELDAFTKDILKKHHDNALKNKWNNLLKEEHGYEAPTQKEEDSAAKVVSMETSEVIVNKPLNNTTSSGKIRKIYKALAFAAGFLLLLSLYFVNFEANTSTLQLADSYLIEDLPPYAETRKGVVELSEKRELAGELYGDKKYNLSALAYQEIIATNEGNNTDLYYLALSELYNDDAQNSIQHFNGLINGIDSKYKKDASWFLSLAHLKAKNMEEAKALLLIISKWDKSPDARGHDKKKALQARALLKSME